MTGKYRVILADPPWEGYQAAHMRLEKRVPGIARNHYSTMTIASIAQLPVAEMVADDAVLFMWITSGKMPDALEVMRAWGFEYVTVGFCWVKMQSDGRVRQYGLGAYTKQNIELCLLGKRGKPARLRKARNVHQVLTTIAREHSRKPDEQYERIMRLFDGPYLELFARQQWPGWDAWGNQAGKFPAQPFLFGEEASA